MKLTPKQKAFADNYIENGGNASAAARDAGYRERAAGSMGAENLKKPQIAAYIAERQMCIRDSLIIICAGVLVEVDAYQVDESSGIILFDRLKRCRRWKRFTVTQGGKQVLSARILCHRKSVSEVIAVCGKIVKVWEYNRKATVWFWIKYSWIDIVHKQSPFR